MDGWPETLVRRARAARGVACGVARGVARGVACGVARGVATRLVVLAGGLAAAAQACSPPVLADEAPEVQVQLACEPSPLQVGPARLALQLLDAAGAALAASHVGLEANMNHAGMVPVLASAAADGAGRYVADVEFSMGGDWFLLVEARLADGRTLRRQLDLPGVRRP